MKYLTITNKRNNQILGNKIGNADSFISRFLGLMGRKPIEEQEGLLINPCNSIHMMFMKFPLDVVFLDRNNKVIHLIEGLKPWRVSPVIFKTQSVLELPEGTISRTETKIEDLLEMSFNNQKK